MTRTSSKSSISARDIIAEALGLDLPPQTSTDPGTKSLQSEHIEAPLAEDQLKERRIKDIDDQIAHIARRHAGGKVGVRQYRRDGVKVLSLLTLKFDITNDIWLYSAHAITQSLDDMMNWGVTSSPLLNPEKKLDDDASKLWPYHGRWEVKQVSIAAILFLKEYCGLTFPKASEKIALKLLNADFRSERGSSETPQAATIERWARDALKTDRHRIEVHHGIVDLFAHIEVSEDETPLMDEASILSAYKEIIERSVLYRRPRRS